MTITVNAMEAIRADRTARTFQIGDLLFAQFTCPPGDQAVSLWAQSDHIVHVLSSTTTWRTFSGTYSAGTGESVFFKKGAYVLPPHSVTDLCILLFFIPDAFVRETVRELATMLPVRPDPCRSADVFMRIHHDIGLSAFFQSMKVYFACEEKPSEPLLKLKLKELLTSILVGQGNPDLSAHFRSLAACEAPSIPAIMEANFRHNLSMEAFAQMCHRSLSSFKREFQRHYARPPGRWLLERRLDCARELLRTTRTSVTEVMFDCGFEDLSHFSRAFKDRFGHPPSACRETLRALA